MNWFTSDLHFFHENIISFCGRPYSDTESMNWGIVKIINSYVKEEDTLYILGDYSFKVNQQRDAIIRLGDAIKARRVLIYGNHDDVKSSANFGFAERHDELFLDIKGVTFRLVHYPLVESRTAYDVEKRPECYVNPRFNPDTKKIYPILCGHVHDVFTMADNCLNVGWDVWRRPISEDEVSRIYDETDGFIKNIKDYNEKKMY